MKNLTSSKYWDKTWKNYSFRKKKILFNDLFNKYLPQNNNFRCIEIGCIPGRFLAYMNKHLGYKIYGVDFANLSPAKDFFKKENIKSYKLYKKDFRKFKTNLKFEIVSSFGFIEHFDNYEEIFKKHVDLLKKNGTLIIELPNFNYGQYYMHKLFDRKNLERHNIKIMDLKILKELADKNKLKLVYLGYYRTADFWIDPIDKHNIFTKSLSFLIKTIFKIISIIINLPNKYFSPYIILVATKK